MFRISVVVVLVVLVSFALVTDRLHVLFVWASSLKLQSTREISVYKAILSRTLVKTLLRVSCGSSSVPQNMEKILDDMQLVLQGRIKNTLCSYSRAEGSEGRRDDGSFQWSQGLGAQLGV